ncbi:MAG: tetratricopeptide repeat protein [Thiotrichaceae bacterium]|nr:tetratricopeptide repeat protein [Thiotrichaceae bacterium]
MARTIGNYDLAQEWLTRLLTIREQEKKNNTDLADVLHELASLYQAQGKVSRQIRRRSYFLKEP